MSITCNTITDSLHLSKMYSVSLSNTHRVFFASHCIHSGASRRPTHFLSDLFPCRQIIVVYFHIIILTINCKERFRQYFNRDFIFITKCNFYTRRFSWQRCPPESSNVRQKQARVIASTVFSAPFPTREVDAHIVLCG